MKRKEQKIMYYGEAERWMENELEAFIHRNGWHFKFFEGYAYTEGHEVAGEDWAMMNIYNLKHEINVTYWTKHDDFEITVDGENTVGYDKESIVKKVKETISKLDRLTA